ncbi:MAG: ribonuclease H-like domain-containing protein [Nitrospinae bacterium]|nr:ribonuclease H-like domain-containing protein [Nitrospinota bacterium]
MEIDFFKKPGENAAPKKRVVVFDIETRLGADEVGGWGNKHLMRVAVAVAHDSLDGSFKVFYEEQAKELIALLKCADLVVGYNIRNFDYAVLRPYTDEQLEKTLPTFDLCEEVEKILRFRLKLDSIAQSTLGVGKSADGLQSLKWVKEGKLDLVRDYCIQDVKVTLDVFNYALENKKLFYADKSGKKKEIPAAWDLAPRYRRG